MEFAHMLLALGMLITGSMNTIITTWADKQSALGTDDIATIWAKLQGEEGLYHKFDHPFFQALGMFIGEFLCMVAYFFTRRKAVALAARDPSIVVPGGRTKGALWFAFPAMLDILGTGTMYAGLCLTSASIFQMMRGSVIVFTCIISVVFLKRTIYGFQWASVLLTIIGICIVGIVSITEESSSSNGTSTTPNPTIGGDSSVTEYMVDYRGRRLAGTGSSTVLVGDILIILAQVATAVQMCLEEKLMTKFPSASLKVVGLEGFFGFWILGFLLVIFYYIRPGGYPIENPPDAIHQMGENWRIPVAIVGNAFSIAFFNFFGISVTQQLSASHRMVLDSVRTLVVWGTSLAIGWEKFHWLQLVGFFVLSLGTAGYNTIIKFPFFYYPEAASKNEAETPAGVSLANEGERDRAGSATSALDASLSTSMIASLVKEETGEQGSSFVHT